MFIDFISSAHLPSKWKVNIMEVLKLGTLPHPYSSKLDLYCGGKEGELRFRTLVHLDRDNDFISGINPDVDDSQFHVNISNFKNPVTSKYSCKISVGTYTNNNLLLLKLQ